MTEKEFKAYLDDLQDLIAIWKADGLGYLSRRCQLTDVLLGIQDDNLSFTVEQLKRMYALTK